MQQCVTNIRKKLNVKKVRLVIEPKKFTGQIDGRNTIELITS